MGVSTYRAGMCTRVCGRYEAGLGDGLFTRVCGRYDRDGSTTEERVVFIVKMLVTNMLDGCMIFRMPPQTWPVLPVWTLKFVKKN